MFSNAHLLQLAIATPLGAALIIALGLPKRFSTKLAAFAFAAPAGIALWLWKDFPAEGAATYFYSSTIDTGLSGFGINLRLGLNGVSLPLFLLAGIVGLAAGIYALRSGAERLKIYLMLLLIMQGGLLGIFASVDIFFFYFFHELALIPTFIMVGVWGGRDRSYAAMKLTIYLTVGAMLSLMGLIAIYVKSGASSFDLETLRQVFADDFDLCRRAGLAGDAWKCGSALEAIAALLPRLQLARGTQEGDAGAWVSCPHCD